MRRVAVLGTGLIGASLGMALRDQGWTVAAWDPSPESLQIASDHRAIDRAAATSREATEGADLIVLCGPLEANLSTLAGLETDALVTDVTSVKGPVVTAAPLSLRFVGGHPLAGREHAGPAAASPGLFRGAPWVLCQGAASPGDLQTTSEMVTSVGANPIVMTAAEHDRVVATISHLPQLLAVALVNGLAEDPSAADLVSGSFRDLTRVASTESTWWPEVLVANSGPVSSALDSLIAYLEGLRRDIATADTQALGHELEQARSRRAQMAPMMGQVRVVLQDRPGEIAAVGHALQTSHVDVRDLQLRHAVHGGGGILTLAVRPGEVETLRSALSKEGFEVESDDEERN
jgi:prephenate dehydrogenase